MQQTPMQDLREDLILTQTSAKEALLEIENQETRKACQEVVKLTLSNIIKRIDEELLEMEKQNMINFLKSVFQQDGFDYEESYNNFLENK
jgi:uncharacterized protein (UPF0335 family)